MKNLILFTAVLFGLLPAHAQENYGFPMSQQSAETLPQKKSAGVYYDEATGEVVEETVIVRPSSNRINNYIMPNSGYQGVGQVQTQPPTIVEAAPLRPSAAETKKAARRDLEVQTETKIVEKLEESRMEDERNRAERLFGDRIQPANNAESNPTATSGFAYPAAPVQVVAPAPMVMEEQAVGSELSAKEEIQTSVKEMTEEDPASYYISGHVGLGEYPDVVNVRGNFASGFSLGVVTPERIIAEGSFLYSNFDVEVMQLGGYMASPYAGAGAGYPYPTFKNLDQYNFAGALKFQILPGRIRPSFGVLASYTYRTYSDTQYYSYAAEEITSNSFDVGLIGGVDVQLTKSFAVGADFRYLTNVANRIDSGYQLSFVNPSVGVNPIEELDYYTFTMSGKFTF